MYDTSCQKSIEPIFELGRCYQLNLLSLSSILSRQIVSCIIWVFRHFRGYGKFEIFVIFNFSIIVMTNFKISIYEKRNPDISTRLLTSLKQTKTLLFSNRQRKSTKWILHSKVPFSSFFYRFLSSVMADRFQATVLVKNSASSISIKFWENTLMMISNNLQTTKLKFTLLVYGKNHNFQHTALYAIRNPNIRRFCEKQKIRKSENVLYFMSKKYRADFRVGTMLLAKPTLRGFYFVQTTRSFLPQ